MRRTRHDVFAKRTTAAYAVVWDLEWQVIACQRLPPGADLHAALKALLAQLEADGWRPESGLDHGFTFVRRGAERRLVMVTGREPRSVELQSFNPFR
jgi:hypothetical protein